MAVAGVWAAALGSGVFTTFSISVDIRAAVSGGWDEHLTMRRKTRQIESGIISCLVILIFFVKIRYSTTKFEGCQSSFLISWLEAIVECCIKQWHNGDRAP